MVTTVIVVLTLVATAVAALLEVKAGRAESLDPSRDPLAPFLGVRHRPS